MPASKSKSGLMAKYGTKLNAAVQAHATDETTYGIEPLPPGIANGIAKLVECKFDVYKSGKNQGEYYFRAAGVVVEPYSVIHQGMEIPVAGRQTSVMLPVCDTKSQDGKITTQDEHVADILNEMRKLAGPEFTHGKTGADLEVMAEQLKAAGPYFRFSTSVRKARDPKEADGVWENWHGSKGLEEYSPPESAPVQDQTGAGAVPAPSANGGGGRGAATMTAAGEFSEFGDIDSLLAQTTSADENEAQAARDALTAAAVKAGKTEDEVEKAENWDQVVVWIKGGGAEAPAAADEKFVPEKGLVYGLEIEVVDPKKKTKVKKVIEVECIAVDPKTEKCDLKNNIDKKTVYKGILWTDIVSPPS